MESVFLAYSFRVDDNELVDKIDRLLISHGLRTITGKSVGGGALTPEVRARIEQSDALIALLTRRDQIPGNGWTTSDWVKDELGHARAKGKPSIAVIEDGVMVGGAYQENEYIPLDRAVPLEAFLRLSETIQVWKESIGRTVAVRLQPEEAAALAAEDGNGTVCEYRLKDEKGLASDWQSGRVYEEAGGVFLYVRGIGDRHQVQVALKGVNSSWRSPFEPYLMHATLKRAASP